MQLARSENRTVDDRPCRTHHFHPLEPGLLWGGSTAVTCQHIRGYSQEPRCNKQERLSAVTRLSPLRCQDSNDLTRHAMHHHYIGNVGSNS